MNERLQTGELEIDSGQSLHFSLNDLIGQRIAVLGISGSGKTNTAAVLIEELLTNGLPMTIVDVEGEYWGLKEQFNLLIAGRSEHAEVPLMVENAPAIAEMSIRRGISVILDLSEYDQEEMQSILLSYFERLWKLSTELKSPYEIIIEEAHEFIPQSLRTPLKTLLTRFALRGRKRGVGVIVSSQRSAKVEKDLLTQAGILFLHSVVHPTDLSVYKDLIPLPAKDVEQQARELVPGEAFVVRGKQVDRVHIRRRHTFHAGATPVLGMDQPQLRTIDVKLLEELRAITARSVKEGGSDEVTKLKKRLKDFEAKFAEIEAENKRLREENALLSKLSVNFNAQQQTTMPSTLEIGQATVHHLHTPATISGPVRQVVDSTVTTKAIEAPTTTPMNEAKFVSLIKRIRQVPSLEIQILRILIEQNRSLSAKDIARWLNKPESSIQNNPPVSLIGLGLIDRSRGSNGYLYRSLLGGYLMREYPNANVQQLQTRVLNNIMI